MKYELIVRPEPFSSPAEFDSYESFETEAFGQWQGETRRDDPNDVRWMQDSLNRLMNLRLPLTGVMDAAARSALRSFQEKWGLTADGVLGPGTKRALAEAATYPGEEEAFPVSRLPARARAALTQGALGKKTSFRYVKDFSGPASECAAALKRAGKTRTEALSIINAQISVAIVMLRKSATALKRGSRSDKTKTLFQKIFKVKPEFVPTWLKSTATIKDRGDVVAIRCKRVAELLASGTIKFFCTINSTNCSDCSNDSSDFACSSWGDESKAPKNSRVVCLGNGFWDDMKAGKTDSLLATLTHEPFHIYYGKYVTEHRSDAGRFGGINCIVQFVFETNGRAAPDRVTERCTTMVVRKEVGGFLSFRPEPFLWPTESEWEGEASRTGPDYIRWLQSSLNRALGLRLAVDGIMGPATRSAVRSFQQRKGLAVDGIVGPNTEAALIAAGAPRPPASALVSAASGGLPAPVSPSRCSIQNCEILHSFVFNDDTPTGPHQEKLAGIAKRVINSWDTSEPINSLLILGHTDPVGPPDYNEDLAMRRAENVSDALAQQMDDLERGSGSRIDLQVDSCGETTPIPRASAAMNRRVEVCFLPPPRWFETGGTGPNAMQPVWAGNDVQYYIDGRSMFTEMVRVIKTAKHLGHYIYLLGWWLDDDFELIPGDDNSKITKLFANASAHRVQVRAMLWDQKSACLVKPAEHVQNTGEVMHINDWLFCGAAILDNLTLRYGSHHQKILIVKGTEGLIGFCGGMDINPDRIWPTAETDGAPIWHTGSTLGAPFHDVHCRIKGPAAYELLQIFLQRWQDHPDRAMRENECAENFKKLEKLQGRNLDPDKYCPCHPLLGVKEPRPPWEGEMYVQVGRTYGNMTPAGYPFAPNGEKTAYRMILKAIAEARRFIYIEDQYLVSTEIGEALKRALKKISDLKVIILIPHGSITDMALIVCLDDFKEQVHYRRQRFIAPLRSAAPPSRLGVFYLSPPGDPGTYVHSKIMVVDDEYAIIGSVNLNRRSLTHDSEALAGIYDPSPDSLAKRLRVALWAKHLGKPTSDLDDGVASVKYWFPKPVGARPSDARVKDYDENDAVETPHPEGDWNMIDPDGS